MMMAHASDAWLNEAARQTSTFDVIRFLSGLPSRLFLVLVGVSAAIKLESQLARGTDRRTMRAVLARRGAQILVLAYVFRIQEHLLAGFHGGWEMLFRVDILNCIGVSMLMLAVFCIPRRGQPAWWPAALLLAVLVGLGPWVGPAQFPEWLPRPLTSYIGGQRPMAWFSLFPFGCWAVTGLLLGHWWVRQSRAGHQARALLGSGVVGCAFIVATQAVRSMDRPVIDYPTTLAQQMGYGSYFLRLGVIGVCAALSWIVVTVSRPGRFSVVRQLGQTSLLIYWVHIEFCYGAIVWLLRGRLTLWQTAIGFAVLTALMLGVSLFRTRRWPQLWPRLAARLRLTPPRTKANVPRGSTTDG